MLQRHMLVVRPDEIIFRPFLPWFLLKNGCLLILATMSAFVGVRSSSMSWWIVTASLLVAAIVLASRYSCRAVILCGTDMIVRTGVLFINEHYLPLWQSDLQIRQGVLGRIFDYGTLTLRAGEQVITMDTIASIRAFRYVVAFRRQELLGLRNISSSYLT
jgi:membrane protein YdbS with pleckstrin-like domain